MAELADAHGSGPCGSNTMRVQVSFPALFSRRIQIRRYLFDKAQTIGGIMADTLEFRYDTQLLLDKYNTEGVDVDDLADDLVDEVRDYILENFKGDCLVVAGDSGEDDVAGEKAILKLHFHTNEPWDVLRYCRSLGEIYDIVVEDMDRQSRNLKG